MAQIAFSLLVKESWEVGTSKSPVSGSAIGKDAACCKNNLPEH